MCTYRRESFVKEFIEKTLPNLEGVKLQVFISNNGPDYSLQYPDNVHVYKNINYGGAGGFSRAMYEAIENGESTHIILADDDIKIHPSCIYRTYAFLTGLKEEFGDTIIAGATISLDEMWLQTERYSRLTDRGFEYFGSYQDTRLKNIAIDNAMLSTMPGIAPWRYCVLSVNQALSYGLALPIFFRGDDIEFSYRISKDIISLPGVTVAHEPFLKRYNEIAENFYLVRNLSMISFIYHSTLKKLISISFVKSFLKNILIFDYRAAELNLFAIDTILKKEYTLPADEIHRTVLSFERERQGMVPTWFSENGMLPEPKRMSVRKRLLIIAAQYCLGFRCGSFMVHGGLLRNVDSFIGRKEVITYDGNNKYSLYKFRWRTAWKLLLKFINLAIKLKINENRLSKELFLYKEKCTEIAFWKEMFKKSESR